MKNFFQVKMRWILVGITLLGNWSHIVKAHDTHYVLDTSKFSEPRPHIVYADHLRVKRDAPASTTPGLFLPEPLNGVSTTPAVSATTTSTQSTVAPKPSSPNLTDDANKTNKEPKAVSLPVASVTQIPILGANGAGQRWTNLTAKVSDPIPAIDNSSDVYDTVVESVVASKDFSNATDDHHQFYNSTFLGNDKYFQDYWKNISMTPADTHEMLSNSYRRATTLKLKFQFPFYGNWIKSITVATGGFIHTGEHMHSWLAATQYIAPLMANFDTTLNNDSAVKLNDDGEKFTAFWENVTLREDPGKRFTFAVTLHKNGDIVFAYKDIPVHIENIDDTSHPVKIGISDAYLTDKIIFYLRRKTIYEYHRVSFTHYEVTNHTILRLTALPTCVQYNTCDSCLRHETGFNCSWCDSVRKCSSGTDRNKQDWQLKNCDQPASKLASLCLTLPEDRGKIVYTTEEHDRLQHDSAFMNIRKDAEKAAAAAAAAAATKPPPPPHSAIGGVIATLTIVGLISGAAGWVLYAFKNPQTWSGQMLIKYRPSQWNWRRGEARYTAATIHM